MQSALAYAIGICTLHTISICSQPHGTTLSSEIAQQTSHQPSSQWRMTTAASAARRLIGLRLANPADDGIHLLQHRASWRTPVASPTSVAAAVASAVTEALPASYTRQTRPPSARSSSWVADRKSALTEQFADRERRGVLRKSETVHMHVGPFDGHPHVKCVTPVQENTICVC